MMIFPFRRPKAAGVRRGRITRRLGVEVLEGRTLPSNGLPDVAVLSTRLENPTSIQFAYQVQGDLGAFHVGVYRSADPTFSANDVPIGGLLTVTPAAASGVQTAHFTLTSKLPIDPARKYVLVVADPDAHVAESSEANNTAFFRKLV